MTMMTTGEFLTSLWGELPQGRVLIWTLPDKKSRWCVHFENVTGDMRFHEREDVYTGVGLAPKDALRLPSSKRLKEWEVAGIAAFWADIDVAHPVHRKSERLPPSIERALEAIAELPFQATIIVDSGHGLQLWWALEEVWLFQDEEDRELARRACQWWRRTVREAFAAHGWTVDSTFDLARVMRLPGTWNNRDPQDRKRVEVLENPGLENPGPRYGKQQFIELIPEDFQATPMGVRRSRDANGRSFTQGSSGLTLDPDAEPSFTRMEALLKLEPRFRATWEKQRPELSDQSPSAYDMALANHAVRANWPDQEVANLLIAFRRRHGLDLKLRENYYAVTIAKAHEPMEREQAEEDLQEALDDPPEDQAEVLKDCLATLFGVDITRIIKYLGDPPVYYMETEQGNITIGGIDRIYSQAKFRQAVGSVTDLVVPTVSGKVWDQRIQAILSACEDIEVGDANHPARETRRWVEDYLLQKPPRGGKNWEKAVSAKRPFVRKRATYMFVEDFQRWLEVTVDLWLDNHEIGRRLRQIGMERKLVNARIRSARTTRTTWLVPDNRLPRRSRQENREENPQENPPPMPGHHGADPEA